MSRQDLVQRSTGKIQVSLTSFADFVLLAGMKKLDKADELWKQYLTDYDIRFDYYKQFRDGIRRLHREGHPVSAISDLVLSITEKQGKRENARLLARGYSKFWASNFAELDTVYVKPATACWEKRGLRVRVSPELAFHDGFETHQIKLYLKKEPPDPDKMPLVLHLMRIALRDKADDNVLSVLDVRRGRLFTETAFNPRRTALLEGEAASFVQMCRSLQALAEIDEMEFDADLVDF